jgi:succinyl-CoA synthetase beta subunit
MKLYEFQAKSLLHDYHVPVPEGKVAETPAEAESIARALGCPVMVKAQVLVGGRGKAGGVKRAADPKEAAARARDILGMKIKGIEVLRVLVAQAVDIASEYYISLTVDRASKAVQCIASASGGMEIEEVAVKEPQRIIGFTLDPGQGPIRSRHFDALARAFSPTDVVEQAWHILEGMSRLFMEKDCSLVEINPCALTHRGSLVAADAKIIFDDNALYKHPELETLRSPEEYGEDEMDAKSHGLSYVGLDGTIGCIVNGAGLSMATMDLIKYFGSSPANFLDVGGSSNPEKVLNALRIISKNSRVTAILINIFGGITRCDDIARGILMAKEKLRIPVPLTIRLIGTNEKEGRQLLEAQGIEAFTDLTEAVQAVVGKAPSREKAQP